jgi:membrane protein
MKPLPRGNAAYLLRHPLRFLWAALKEFRAAQGLLLAGAVAYYSLLSIVPLLIISAIALSHWIDQAELLRTIGRYLEWLLPGQSRAIVAELANFLAHRDVVGPVLVITMIFFSSLAFGVLESSMAVIFHHRKAERTRHFLVSAVMPYLYVLSLSVGLFLVTVVSGALQVIGEENIDFLGRSWSLSGVSGALLYLLGLAGEIFMLTSLYLVMPVGRLRLRHALLGGVTAALLWEVTRRGIAFYFSTLSQVNVRLADDRDRRAVQPRDRRAARPVRRADHRAVRTTRADRHREATRRGRPDDRPAQVSTASATRCRDDRGARGEPLPATDFSR